jgi:hypothetical protein
MTEQRPQPDADDMASSGAPADTFSSNGTYPDAAVGVAEPAEAPETAEITDAADDEPTAVETESTAAEPAPDEGAAFLAELARAMQTTAGLERKRLEEDADRRREAHLEAIQARRETEAATMRELAAEELKGIDAWAEGERERIERERERRAAALQEDLEISLTEHGSKIEQEIEGVDAAIANYRTEVDGFFAALDQETDPVEIARQAGRRPLFPDLDAVSTAEPNADQAAIGVMDPEAEADPAVAWSQWNEATAEPAEATAEPTAEEASPAPETVAVTATSTDQAASGGLLQSVPVHRPFSWLRGEKQEDE